MYHLTKIKNIWKLIKPSSDGGYYYIDTEKKFKVKNGSNDLPIIDTFKCEIVEYWNNGFFINENLYIKDSIETEIFNDNIFKQLFINDELVIIKKLDFINESISFGVFNFLSKKISYKKNEEIINPILSCLDTCFISRVNSKFSLYTVDFKKVWQFVVEDLECNTSVYMDDNLLVVEEKLFFTLLGTQNNRTICIDIKTGEKLGEYKELVGWLNSDENIIYNIRHGQTFVSLNVITNELNEWDMSDLLQQNSLEFIDYSKWCVKNDLLYFAHNIGADINSKSQSAIVGIINIKTKQLEWKSAINKEDGMVGGIRVFGNRIFVETQANVLHVYEINKNEA